MVITVIYPKGPTVRSTSRSCSEWEIKAGPGSAAIDDISARSAWGARGLVREWVGLWLVLEDGAESLEVASDGA
jgi:hypothetical protein